MSQRQAIADNLAKFCIENSMNDSYGVSVQKSKDSKGKEHWSVLFCKARILDGVVRVYAPGFILITWQTAIRDLPRNGRQVCKTEAEAINFLKRFT